MNSWLYWYILCEPNLTFSSGIYTYNSHTLTYFGMEPKERLDYRNKIILAPMVRIGTLPMRLLALEYGADIVYTEELIDWKLLRSVRRINDVLGTVDFVDKTDGTIVFRTCSKEKKQLVLQLGTCDPERALAVAKKVEHDIAGIDINMGCPKSFSLKGGMGAALMSPYPPKVACTILTTLVKNLSIPVTCKVRVFSSIEETIRLCEALQETGITAIAIHGRTKEERPKNEVRIETIKAVAQTLKIPVIANGGSSHIHTYLDILKFREKCQTSSIMVARTASKCPAIFKPSDTFPTDSLDTIIEKYLRFAVDYDNAPSNTKYCIQMMLGEKQSTTEAGRQLSASQTLEQICSVWNLGDYCRSKELEYQSQGLLGRRQVCPDNLATALDDLQPLKIMKIEENQLRNDLEINNVLKIENQTPISKTIIENNIRATEHIEEPLQNLLQANILVNNEKVILENDKNTMTFEDMQNNISITCSETKDILNDRTNKNEYGKTKVDIFTNNFNDEKTKVGDENVIQLRCAFIRASFPNDLDLPKSKLMLWCVKNKVNAPVYKTEQREKLFQSVVTVADKKYTSTYWEKNKRFAEQGAALVCLHHLGVIDMDTLIKLGSVL